MSYSRWIDSCWYVYPHVDGWIECDYVEGVYLRWKPDMTYDDFKEIVREQVIDVTDRYELYSILDENMDDIKQFLIESKAKQKAE